MGGNRLDNRPEPTSSGEILKIKSLSPNSTISTKKCMRILGIALKTL